MSQWELIDRREPGATQTIAADQVSKDVFPYAIQVPCPPFMLGKIGALIPYDGLREARLMQHAMELLAACEAFYVVWRRHRRENRPMTDIELTKLARHCGNAIVKATGTLPD